MQRGTFAARRITFLLLALLLAPAAQAKAHRWTLRTADTTVTLATDADHPLLVERLSHRSGWNWTRTPSNFPLVSRGGVAGQMHALQWQFQSSTEDHTDGETLTLIFTNAEPALRLTSIWQAHPGPGPIRHSMFIENLSGKRITLGEQESLDLHLTGPAGAARVTYISDDASTPDAVGVYQDAITNGYEKVLPVSESQDFIPYAAVHADSGEGVYIGWEWSIGRIRVAKDAAHEGIHLEAGNRDDFQTELAPGEKFEVPSGFVGAYRGTLDNAANSLHPYLFRYSMPAELRTDPSYPKVEWNAFAATGQGLGSWYPVEKKYYTLIDQIAPLGFETMVIDVDWWEGDPTHRPEPAAGSPKRWPHGMLAARDYAHQHGMTFGLYWNDNPSMTTEAGIERRVRQATYLFDKFKIDFYRSDDTDGNVLQTGGYGPGTRAHSPQDVGYWQTKGFYQFLDTMYRTVPDFRYEDCAGGGHLKDYGILRRAYRIQAQDRYYPLDARRAFYDSSYAMHPIQIAALVGSWADWQASGSVYEFRSASLGAPYWHPDAPNGGNGGPAWTPAHKEAIKDAVETYKTMIRPLVRTANLYHIFPRPDGKHWDGVEYFDPATGKGAAIIFRPESPDGEKAIPFQGLEPRHHYWVWSADKNFVPYQASGKELMQSQLVLHLPSQKSSDILFLSDAASGKPIQLASSR